MKELDDNQIRVIGGHEPKKPNRKLIIAILALGIVIVTCFVLKVTGLAFNSNNGNDSINGGGVIFDPENVVSESGMERSDTSHVTSRDTIVNGIGITVYSTHGLTPSLQVGPLPRRDSVPQIEIAIRATDIKNDSPASTVIAQGELLSTGEPRNGFCAIIGGQITLGVDEATAYFETAIQSKGDFFRQYPLVSDRRVAENKLKNKSYRHALAYINDEIVLVTTGKEVSLRDFSKALVEMGAVVAVNLSDGEMKSGWIKLHDKTVIPEEPATEIPDSVNYIIWTKK